MSGNKRSRQQSEASAPVVPEAPADSSTMYVCEQHGLAEEVFSRNGTQKKLYSTVKNIPFLIGIKLGDKVRSAFEGEKIILESKLFYDDTEEKEVQVVKTSPLEYTTNLDKNTGCLRVEVIMKVLSSQHEDSFFVLKFSARDKTSGNEITSALSSPIRVVSKLHQIRKILAKLEQALPTQSKAKAKKVDCSLVKEEPSSPSSGDHPTILTTLTAILEQQQEQQQLLNRLCQRTAALESILVNFINQGSPSSSPMHSFDISPQPAAHEENSFELFGLDGQPPTKVQKFDLTAEEPTFTGINTKYCSAPYSPAPELSSSAVSILKEEETWCTLFGQ